MPISSASTTAAAMPRFSFSASITFRLIGRDSSGDRLPAGYRRTGLAVRGTFLFLREQLGLVLPPNPLRHFARVVDSAGVAAAMGEAKVVQIGNGARDWRRNLFDPGPLVVASRQVEPHRPAAPGASIAITGPEQAHSRGLLLALVLPRGHIFGDDPLAHGAAYNA